jgi:iron complex outermembrane receptor protein
LFEAHTEQAANIEVIRGPGSAYYGSNALHGIVNIITPDVPDSKQSKLVVEAGSYNFTRLKTNVGDGNLGDGHIDSANNLHGYNLALTVSHDGGYRDDSGYDQQKFTGRHLYSAQDLTVNSGLTITNLDQQTAGFILGKDSFQDNQIARSNLNPEAFRKAESLRLWSRFELQSTEANLLVITPYFRLTDMSFRQHFLPGKPLEENGQQSIGLQSAYYLEPVETFKFSIGIDGEISDGFLKQTQENSTEGSAFLQATIPSGKQYDYDVNASMFASFFHLDWQFLTRWQLSAGIRYEHMNYVYDNKMFSGRTTDDGAECGFGGCRYSRPEDRTDSFNNWAPKVGISYLLPNKALLFTNLSRGFRAPQATELYRLQREQTVADLDSVKLDSFEFGVRRESSHLSYELVYYQMDKDNVIFRDSNFFNISNGKTEHRGLEGRIDYLMGEYFVIAVNATIAEHRYASDQLLGDININGNDIDTAPKHFSNTQIKWKPSEGLELELEWSHQGAYYMDAENLHRYSGHNLLNLRAKWELNNRWNIFARINNLLDKKYAERADYTFFTQERYFPGTPLSLFVGVEWRGIHK